MRRLQPLAKIVIDEQNVEAELFEQKANLSRWPMKAVLRWQAWRIDVLESQLLSSCDAVLACSSRDKEHLQRRGATHVRVVANGVDVEEMQVAPGPERMDVVLVGSMDWWPNSDAAMRLVKEIWPLVAPAVAPSRLAIVGRNPAGGAARASQRPGGDIRNGGQREAVFGRLLGYRDAAAGRLRHPPKDPRGGRGGRSGRCTRLVAEGLPFVDGVHALYAETPHEFQIALERLWNDRVLAQGIAENASRLMPQFDWPLVGGGLADFYRALTAGHAPSAQAPS